ncbi:MAG: hypothetical protein WCG91_04300 [Candidatus Shapirobacteria bacterium]
MSCRKKIKALLQRGFYIRCEYTGFFWANYFSKLDIRFEHESGNTLQEAIINGLKSYMNAAKQFGFVVDDSFQIDLIIDEKLKEGWVLTLSCFEEVFKIELVKEGEETQNYFNRKLGQVIELCLEEVKGNLKREESVQNV